MRTTVSAPLYMRAMGASWNQLAESVRCLHGTGSIVHAQGRLRIEHGRHHGVRFLAAVLRLPRPSAAAHTRLTVLRRANGEHWQRTFNTRRLDTWQYDADPSDLAERFGLFEFRFRLAECDGSLVYVQREAAFRLRSVRLPIPAWCAPRVEAQEDPVDATRVRVEVRVVLPVVGLLIAYDGVIDVEDTRA